MNHRTQKYMMSLAVAGSLLAVNQATAAMVLGPTVTTTPVPSTLTDWSSSLTFPQFNPALGTLDSVTLALQSGLVTTLTVENTGGATSSGTVRTELVLTPTDPLNQIPAGDPLTVDYMTPKQSFTLAGGQGITLPQMSASGNSANTYTAGLILSEFTGNGSINLGLSTVTYTLLSYNGGNSYSSQVTTADATGSVTYDYTAAVPEPSTYLAGLSALGMLGLVGWRKRK